MLPITMKSVLALSQQCKEKCCPKMPANRKGWELTLNIQPQICHNKMDTSKKFASLFNQL